MKPIIIDKSLFSPVERRQYEALIAKAAIASDEDPPASYAQEPTPDCPVGSPQLTSSTGVIPPPSSPNLFNPSTPSNPTVSATPTASPFSSAPFSAPSSAPSSLPGTPSALTVAIARLEQLEQSITWKECIAVARHYALLGEPEENLAQTLFDLKQTDEANYTAYVSALDKSLALLRKSGLFREIGKCSREPAYGASWETAGGSVMEKIQAEAKEIQRNHPELNQLSAMARAWENHPELVREYNATYRVR